jgi:hypothetical protein
MGILMSFKGLRVGLGFEVCGESGRSSLRRLERVWRRFGESKKLQKFQAGSRSQKKLSKSLASNSRRSQAPDSSHNLQSSSPSHQQSTY